MNTVRSPVTDLYWSFGVCSCFGESAVVINSFWKLWSSFFFPVLFLESSWVLLLYAKHSESGEIFTF